MKIFIVRATWGAVGGAGRKGGDGCSSKLQVKGAMEREEKRKDCYKEAFTMASLFFFLVYAFKEKKKT